MKILISGAGPAGLVIAYWLKKYGFTPTLIEKAPMLRKGGYNLDIRGPATEVSKRMGIYDRLFNLSSNIKTALLINQNGKVIHKINNDVLRHRMHDDLEIMRDNTCQALMDHIPDVEIIFDDSIEMISQTPDIVRVNFKKNALREFDLVIGADGLHSNVRFLVFGDESQFVHELGIYYCIFTIPNYLNLDQVEMQYTDFGKLMNIWSRHGDKKATVSFAFTSPTPPHDVEGQKKWVQRIFKGMGGEAPKILEMMTEAPDFYFDITGQVRMNHWSSGRVVLLGDAAYAPSPSSGQGLSLAMVGAYILAGELAINKEDFKVAFAQFEKEMREFVHTTQALGIKNATLFKLQEKKNWFAVILIKLMRILPGRMIEYISKLSTRYMYRAGNSITLKYYENNHII